jgi:hypothetical protein
MPHLRCDRCLWWENEHPRLGDAVEQGYGYCRKHKPVVFAAKDRYWGGWPLTDRADFCGEHMPRKDT